MAIAALKGEKLWGVRGRGGLDSQKSPHLTGENFRYRPLDAKGTEGGDKFRDPRGPWKSTDGVC